MFNKYTQSLGLLMAVALKVSVGAAADCKPSVAVHSEIYQFGQEIEVHFAQCGQDSAHSDDFLAIYKAETDSEDIKGDANYQMWMWSCGSQFCHTSAEANSVTFGPEANKHTWPLPPGEYQVHLIKSDSEGLFASQGVSAAFMVEEDDFVDSFAFDRALEDTCEDEVTTAKACVQEGDTVSVLLQNECQEFEEGDWFGFYYEDECDEDSCEGEPLLWSWVCKGDDCNRPRIQYKFKHAEEILLPVGRYQVAVVASEDEEIGEYDVIYEPTLLSRVFEVHPEGEPCTVDWRIS